MNKTSFAILLLTALMVSGFTFMYLEIQKVKDYQYTLVKQNSIGIPPTMTQSDPQASIATQEYKKLISDYVTSAIATLSAVAKSNTVSSSTTPPIVVNNSSQKQTTYIPLSGPVSSTSTDWIDAPGTDVTIDLAEYSKDAKVSLEASLKIANASGAAFARIYDVTHGIAVLGSEVSVNNATFTTVSSGNLNLWSGKNLYRVQIKSLNSQEATFGSGRIKIIY